MPYSAPLEAANPAVARRPGAGTNEQIPPDQTRNLATIAKSGRGVPSIYEDIKESKSRVAARSISNPGERTGTNSKRSKIRKSNSWKSISIIATCDDEIGISRYQRSRY
jgi:hypothetical protein